jgi:hypothetical protein
MFTKAPGFAGGYLVEEKESWYAKKEGKVNLRKSIFLISLIFAIPELAFALNCDGKITQVLSGNNYCSGGERVGFNWTGGSSWMCSSNRNMDALIVAAYASGKTVSVRDSSWSNCFGNPAGTIPDHIWFQE